VLPEGSLAEALRSPPRAVARAGRDLARDSSLSAVTSGVVAIVVGYAGPAVVVATAAAAGGLSPARSTSWFWAVSLSSGLLCLVLSLWTRMPIVIAWSTPGAALLVTSLAEHPYPAVVGTYLVVSVATVLVGMSGWFGRVIRRIPGPLVSAMLAGVLFSFGVNAFRSLGDRPVVPAAVLIAFLVGRRIDGRYAVPLALLAGGLAAAATGQLGLAGVGLELARPVWTGPGLDGLVAAVVGIGVPLFVVTMTAQNAAGISVLAAHGYRPDDRRLITATGLGSALGAPFGSHGINLAAITAAICAGSTTHPDPRRRYVAGVTCGVLYLVVGSFGATLVAVFGALPPALVATVAGVALLSAITAALSTGLADAAYREPAVVTLLTTASGVTLLGIGSAFWGLVFGLAVDRVLRPRPTSVVTSSSDDRSPAR
jgi:benzoate membrane transport protein